MAYGDDLSRLRVPDQRPRQRLPAQVGTEGAKSATRTLPLNPDELRALFHRPEFNRTDGLAAYHDDPAWRPQGPAVRRGLALSNQPVR